MNVSYNVSYKFYAQFIGRYFIRWEYNVYTAIFESFGHIVKKSAYEEKV